MSSQKRSPAGSLYVGLAAALAAAVLTLVGYWHSGTGTNQLYFALGFPAIFGVLCRLMHRRRFHAWLAGLCLGFISGAVSAVPLLAGGNIEGGYYASSATLAFFAVLGFVLGAAGEFVRLLHYVAHGGSVLDYPEPPAVSEPPRREP